MTARPIAIVLAGGALVTALPATDATAASGKPGARGKLGWVVATVLSIALLAMVTPAVIHLREPPPSPPPGLRFQIPPPGTSAAEMFTLSADGRHLAFIANTGGPSQLWLRDMEKLDPRALAGTDGATYPFWSPDGAYLGFFAQGKLKKIAVAGGPPQTLCDVADSRGGTWNRDGVIVFSAGPTTPLWRVSAAGGVPAPVTTLAAKVGSVAGHLAPAFLPDGVQKSAAGNGQEQLLFHAGASGLPTDWSPDGKWILFQQTGLKTAIDLWLLPLDGDRTPIPYLQTPFIERDGAFSPDGRWMAYQSDESGQAQIYVETIPASGAKHQISSAGGTEPRWRRDGKELFYISTDQKLMAVPIALGARVEAGTPQALFHVVDLAGYAPTRDGQRFLVNVPAGSEGAAAPPITVVVNWTAGLKQ